MDAMCVQAGPGRGSVGMRAAGERERAGRARKGARGVGGQGVRQGAQRPALLPCKAPSLKSPFSNAHGRETVSKLTHLRKQK